MKKLANIFIFIGLLASILILIFYIMAPDLGTFYVAYGFYSFLTSVVCLLAVNGGSKKSVVICGILYVPVMLIASVFMFCIKPRDLY